MSSVLLPSAYLAPIAQYGAMLRGTCVQVEVMEHYRKQTVRNRCMIASPNGPLSLTIPVEKPAGGKVLMRDVRISEHGNWRHQHWNALVSSYRQTPFFEYYQDDFAPFYEKRWDFLVDFNEDLRLLVCSLMDIQPQVTPTTAYVSAPDDVEDWRQDQPPVSVAQRPYYQLFADRHGFQAGLSIVDLLFNMGPESILYL